MTHVWMLSTRDCIFDRITHDPMRALITRASDRKLGCALSHEPGRTLFELVLHKVAASKYPVFDMFRLFCFVSFRAPLIPTY